MLLSSGSERKLVVSKGGYVVLLEVLAHMENPYSRFSSVSQCLCPYLVKIFVYCIFTHSFTIFA